MKQFLKKCQGVQQATKKEPEKPPSTGPDCFYAEEFVLTDPKHVCVKTDYGINFSGECPRCKHETSFTIPRGAAVTGNRLTGIGLGSSGLDTGWTKGVNRAELAEVTTLYCLCGHPHKDRPSAHDSGCGAYWYAR